MINSIIPTYNELVAFFKTYCEETERDEKEKSKSVNSVIVSPLFDSVSKMKKGMEILSGLTGMDNIKEKIESEINYYKIMNMRKKAGHKIPKRLPHMLLTGNPGTGKSTVARLIAQIYKEEGILKKGQIIETCRAQIVGRWIGETEQRMTDLIQAANGGILFIDEIYSLIENDIDSPFSNKDFGIKAIDTLMPILSDPYSGVMVIGAGYSESISNFIAANPGLASRFPNVWHFNDFSFDQMLQIAITELTKIDFSLSEKAMSNLKELIRGAMRYKHHGNARLINNIIHNHVLPSLCNRLYKSQEFKSIDIKSTNIILDDDIPSLYDLFPLHYINQRRIGYN